MSAESGRGADKKASNWGKLQLRIDQAVRERSYRRLSSEGPFYLVKTALVMTGRGTLFGWSEPKVEPLTELPDGSKTLTIHQVQAEIERTTRDAMRHYRTNGSCTVNDSMILVKLHLIVEQPARRYCWIDTGTCIMEPKKNRWLEVLDYT
ncbi:hypothetical protein [[Eubacterium] cellulosolvens]